MTRFLLSAALVLSLAGASAQAANPLAPPQTLTSCQLADGTTSSGPFACDGAGVESAAVLLLPTVQLSSNFDSAPGFDTIASAQYAFTLVGGHSGDLVPLLVDTRLVSAAAGNSFAAAGIVVTIGFFFVQERVCTRPSDCPQTSFTGTLHIGMTSGQSGTVSLVTQAASGFPVAGPASAFADPFIRVDPAFAGAANYSVVVADGVGNAPVPEPATWLLSAAGLGCIIGVRARRRRGQAELTPHRPHRTEGDCFAVGERHLVQCDLAEDPSTSSINA